MRIDDYWLKICGWLCVQGMTKASMARHGLCGFGGQQYLLPRINARQVRGNATQETNSQFGEVEVARTHALHCLRRSLGLISCYQTQTVLGTSAYMYLAAGDVQSNSRSS